ncbi:MAG: hypothetical protein ABJB33_02335 [Gemmatimonadota bacterium]
MIRLTSVSLAILVALGCRGEGGATGPDGYSGPPLFDRIIFTSIHPDSHYTASAALWTMATDGTDPRPLLGHLHWPESPSVSPDGRTVVFEDWWELFLVDASGEGLRKVVLPAGVRATNPKWALADDWILFDYQATPSADKQLYRIRSNGSGLQRLTFPDGVSAWGGNWSPDGERIAFIRQVYEPVHHTAIRWVVTKMLATGDEAVVVDSTAGFTGYLPSWSPDGQSLFLLDVSGNDWVIGRLELATSRYDLLGSARGNRPPTLSPDGTRLLYGTGDLWLAGADNSDPHVVLSNGRENFEAFWTPTAPTP